MASVSERIIEEVKTYSILYDLSHSEYKNIRKKNEIWDEIGKSLDAEGDDVKKKWNNLRDAYAKHLRSEKTLTEQKAKSIDRYKTWPWAQQMSFFKSFLQFLNTESNVRNTEDINSTQTEDITSDFTTDLYQSPISSPSVISDGQRQSSVIVKNPIGMSAAKKRRLDKYQPSQQPTAIKKVSNYLGNRNSMTQNSDKLDLLFREYAKTVKKFTVRRQTIVKFKIAKLLMEEEMQQQLEDEAATISRPTSRLTDSVYTSSIPESSLRSHAPILDSFSDNPSFDEERRTDAATRWYEGFAKNIM